MGAIGRTLAVLAVTVAAGATFSAPASASGGGGCGRPISTRDGTRVGITEFCFGPTVVRVPVGGTVTFTNHDPYVHTVLGANGAWGSFEELAFEESVSYVFRRRGVFPFVCTLHPGMSGAVQVGGSKAGSSVIEDPAVPLPASPVRLVGRVPASSPSGGAGWQVAATAEAMLLLIVAGLVLARPGRGGVSSSR